MNVIAQKILHVAGLLLGATRLDHNGPLGAATKVMIIHLLHLPQRFQSERPKRVCNIAYDELRRLCDNSVVFGTLSV